MSFASEVNTQVPNKNTKFTGFTVPDILSWKNPYETGILFAETLGFFIIFSRKLFLRYCLKFSALIIGFLSITEFGTRAISGPENGLISSYKPSRFLPLNDSFVNDVAGYVASTFRRVVFGAQNLLDAKNPYRGLQLSGVFYAAYIALSVVSLNFLILTSILSAFTLPYLYLHFKSDVDGLVNTLLEQLDDGAQYLANKINSHLGSQIESLKKLLKIDNHHKGKGNVTASSTDGTTEHVESADRASTASHVTPKENTSHESTTTSHESTSTAHSTAVPQSEAKPLKPSEVTNIVNEFDSVPTLAGNVPINKESLAQTLQDDYDQTK